jgi:hypothetical protein
LRALEEEVLRLRGCEESCRQLQLELNILQSGSVEDMDHLFLDSIETAPPLRALGTDLIYRELQNSTPGTNNIRQPPFCEQRVNLLLENPQVGINFILM